MVGKKILVGKVQLEGIDLCRPCRHLSEVLGHENIIKEFLRRGGLRCQILSSSIIEIGNKIKIVVNKVRQRSWLSDWEKSLM